MLGLELTGNTATFVSLGIVCVMFLLFLRETQPPEVIAFGTAALMLVLGLLPYDLAVQQLSNSAPWTIAFLFILMGGLMRTGALDVLTQFVGSYSERYPAATIGGLFVVVALASGFMNNTPVVALMIPVMTQLALRAKISPSKLLMPLSYVTVMGGMVTLIGTSTNLLVDGVAQSRGMEPFSIFEIAPVGLAVTAVGGLFLALIGRKLIPERTSLAGFLSDRSEMKYFSDIAIPFGSGLIGEKLGDVDMFKRDGVRVVDVLRGDGSLRDSLDSVELAAGDRVVLRSKASDVLEMQQNKDVRLVDKLSQVETVTVEVLITPGARMIGRRLGDMRLRRRYGVYVLAAHRRSQSVGRKLGDLVIRVGDTLLLEGRQEDIARLATDMDLVDVAQPSSKPFRRVKAPIAIGALFGVVVLAAMNVAPILLLAAIACAVILVTGCVDADEAFENVDARLMTMIFSMLCIGAAMDHVGAVKLIVDAIAPYLQGMSPFITLICVYFLGLFLTEILSNNAVAVILTPIVIELADQLGQDPRAYVVAVMFSASVAFATPIGYQTHMMVYGPGGYKFSDFLRVGIPLDIVTGTVACLVIPIFWPLTLG